MVIRNHDFSKVVWLTVNKKSHDGLGVGEILVFIFWLSGCAAKRMGYAGDSEKAYLSIRQYVLAKMI
jgi:hypothetical protein